ncbi:enkurin domain-containing protein 1-like [Amphiura filiformis]|uniref:enkurin domain-containing protein 1-like n=1 Tax=Amphiura filiformis TaxID=82378 RepID=UPI003B214B90
MMSPIPADPGYMAPRQAMINKWSAENHQAKPRVRPEAEEIAKTHQGSVGLLLELQGKPVYRPPPKPKPQPKDFGNANVKKMRQVQAANRRRQREETAEKTQPVKVLPQSEKYKEVPSKLSEHLKKDAPPPRPQSANYLRSHSRTGGAPRQRGRSPSPGPAAPRRRSPSPAPRSQSAAELRGSGDVNFVAHNARSVKKYQPPRAPSAMSQQALEAKRKYDEVTYKKGQVPKYLQNRQNQWKKEEEDRIRNTPDPDMPPGHRKMPNDERKKTLQILKDKEKELMNELHQLPIHTETLRAKMRRKEVEGKIAEVEEAIKIFSRSKVFVKIDS